MPRSATHTSMTSAGDTYLDIPPVSHAHGIPLVTMLQRNGLRCYPIHRICPRWRNKGCFWNCNGNGVRPLFYNHQHTCCCTAAFLPPGPNGVTFNQLVFHFNAPALPVLNPDPSFVQLADYIYHRILNNQLQPTLCRHGHIHPTTMNTMNAMPNNTGFMSWLFQPIDITVFNRDQPQQFLRSSTAALGPNRHVVDLSGMYTWLDVQTNAHGVRHLRVAMKLQIAKHLEDLFLYQLQSRGVLLQLPIHDPDFPA